MLFIGPEIKMIKQKLTILTDIPTPYRVFFFTQVYRELLKRDIDFEVMFMAKSVPIRYWEVDTSKWDFPFCIAKGIHLYIGANSFHFNPGLIWNILVKPPRWLIVGGAWNIPTSFLSIFIARIFHKHTCTLSLWSEANRYSMVHKKGIVAFFRKIITNSVDVFAVPGELAVDTIKKEWAITNKKFLLLPNLIDEKKFSNLPNVIRSNVVSNRCFHDFKISDEDIVLLWPARLHEKTKGILNFLTAVKDILHNSHLKIVIAGDGPDKDRIQLWLKEYLPDNVVLIGQQTETEMLDLYSMADVLLLPSLSDPNPLSVIEGLWSSLPLLISNHCGNQIESVKLNFNGWSFDPLSADSMKCAVQYLRDTSKEALAKYGENSLTIAKEKFNSSLSVRAFLDKFPENNK